jgi:serralysin
MRGGLGDDRYSVDSALDQVVELANQGTDTVLTTLATYVLGAHVETVIAANTIAHRFIGNALANVMAGNAGSDTLIGGAGNDTLQGGGAIDWLYGGSNDDTYFVETATDRVIEGLNQGIDTVRTAAPAFTLPLNVETLVGTFAGGQALTGNTLDNAITGFTGADTLNGGLGNDTLDGGAGIDRLLGGAGNDSFRIEAATDVVIELANQGTDTVIMLGNAGYTLGANVENLVLAGATGVSGVGNTLGNAITGNAAGNVLYGLGGNDSLDGGAGIDVLIGGAGRDTLTGGAGNDQFRFLAPGETTVPAPDRIADFTPGQDRIDLRFIDGAFATPLAYVTGAPVAAGQVGVVAIGAGVWQVQGDLDGGGTDFAITVASATAPSAGWFLL